MGLRGLRTAVALAALAALVAAPGATAVKSKKKTKSPPVTVVTSAGATSGDNQQLSLTATCPAGKLAVGGGFVSQVEFTSGLISDLNEVYESRRAGASSWQVSAVREDAFGSGPPVSLTASVHCRSRRLGAGKAAAAAKRRRLKISEVSATGSAPSHGAQAIARATCPAKKQALGGGFSSAPTSNLSTSQFPLFWASYRLSPGTWLAALTNVGATARTVTSYAYCAAGLRTVQRSASAVLPPGGATTAAATATAPACGKGRALLGGGFNDSPIVLGGASAFLTGSSAPVGPWQVSAANVVPFSSSLGSFAYCA